MLNNRQKYCTWKLMLKVNVASSVPVCHYRLANERREKMSQKRACSPMQSVCLSVAGKANQSIESIISRVHCGVALQHSSQLPFTSPILN